MVREGYKQTEVGVIPKDWEVTQLKKLIHPDRQITYGIVVPGPNIHNGVPIIRAQDYSRGWVDLEDLYRVSAEIDKSYKRSRVVADDILLTIVGSVGNLAKVPKAFSGSNLTQQTARLAFNSQIADANFYFNILRSDFGQTEILNYTKSGVQPSLNLSDVDKFRVPYPPLPEQRAIAATLSDVDALIASLDKLIAKQRHLKTATMQQLLTGKKRLPGFSGEWELKQVNELGVTYGGLTGKRKADFGMGTSKYITFLNVINNVQIDTRILEKVSLSESEYQNNVRKGDLLFNTSSETPEEVGMCSVLSEDLGDIYLNSFCFGFRVLDSLSVFSLYLAYFFRSDEGRKHLYSLAQGATRYNLSKTNFLKLVIKLPAVEEQRAIATVLSDMDAAISALETRRAKTQAIKQGMMQELLTGRTRLV